MAGVRVVAAGRVGRATAGASSPSRASRVAIVPIGYADGIARALTNRGDVLVAGRRCRISGTISMDQLTVLLPDDHGKLGDDVVFFGAAGRAAAGDPAAARILCEEVARLLGTINYEIVCDVSPRAVRRYRGAAPAAADVSDAGRRRAVSSSPRSPPPPVPVSPRARRAWLVGGCVRDELLGRPLNDVDLVVDGDEEAFARRLADRLAGAVFASSERFGTWRVVVAGRHVDVAALRGGLTPDAGDARTRVSRPTSAAGTSRSTPSLAPCRAASWSTRCAGSTTSLPAACGSAGRGALEEDPLRVLRLTRLARGYGLVPRGGRDRGGADGGAGARRESAASGSATSSRRLLAIERGAGSRLATARRDRRPRRGPSRGGRACAAWSRTRITTSTSSVTRWRRSPTYGTWSPSCRPRTS